MKTIQYFLALIIAVLSGTFVANASVQHFETTTFTVYGNCEMCKKRIEDAFTNNPAVKSAQWDVATKMLKITYDPHSISVDELHKIVAAAGHDTDKVKADNAVYKKLHSCCQYERRK